MTPTDYLRRATSIALCQARAGGAITAWAAPPRVPHSFAASTRRFGPALARDTSALVLQSASRSTLATMNDVLLYES